MIIAPQPSPKQHNNKTTRKKIQKKWIFYDESAGYDFGSNQDAQMPSEQN